MRSLLYLVLNLLLYLFAGSVQGRQRLVFDQLSIKDGLSQRTVRSIVKDRHGFMWFGTWNGLCRYDGYRFRTYLTISGDSTSLSNNRVHYIHKDEEGVLWVSTFNSYVCRYNDETDDFTRFKINEVSSSIREAVNRSRNLDEIWRNKGFLNENIGSFDLSESKEHIVFQLETTDIGLKDNNINCIYRDTEEGILWLGTTKEGVLKANLNATKFDHFSVGREKGNESEKSVRAIWAGKTGIWIGTHDDGLYRADLDSNKPQKVDLSLSGNNIRSLFVDGKGNLWIGSRSGLDRYFPRTGQVTSYFGTNSEKSIDRFYAIAEDPLDGSLWFGSYSTIWRYDPTYGRFEKQDLDGIYTNSGAGCLFFDSKYRLWIGTEYSGLIRVDRDAGTGRWQNVKVYKANGTQAVLPDERVYTVSEDGQGAIWIGTANGLCRLNPDTDEIAGFGTAGGLVNTYITKLLWDPENEDMWFAHKQGLSKISTIDFNIDNYTVKGNTSDYEFMEGAGFRDIQNKLYFGGMDGFITFIPHHIQDNLSQPKLVFTRFSVLNKDIRIGESISGAPILTKDINLTESIRLAYTNNSFSIEFSALHFTDPKRNKYAYKLDGYDGTWVSADATSRSATYTNLPPGNYTFYLKGANSDGIWSEEAKTVKIYILPPWWMTYWAYSGYLILAIVAGYLGLRIVHNRQHLQQKLLAERLQREQVVALEKSKSEFFTQVSHEFRTPLTLILDPLQQLTSQESLSGERRKTYYDIMQRNTGRLLNLVNQLLDFRKIESDNMELVATSDDLLLIVRHCVQGFALQAKQQQVSLIFLTNEQEHFSFGVNRDAVEKIIYNLLSNALKYTPPRGEIRVSVRQDKDEALLQVSNTGEGIALEDINRIFDPFYQIKGNTVFGQNTGSGIGLSLVKSLAHQHGGHVQLTSAPNDSTLFTVTLSALQSPVNDNAVRPDPDKSEWMEEQYIAKKGEELILIVEDVPDIRDYLAMIIRDNGYRVATATNGEKGLDRAREMIPDLILSDIMMPGKDGMAFCFEVKSDERTSHIPVILLTAKQDMVVEKQGYESGADAYIVKPFLSELLMVRIKNLLASRQQLRKLFAGTPAFTVALESIGEKDKAFIHKTMALIEANMGVADLDVIWLAEQLYLSRTQLYRKIKALTDQSVHEFITSVRLKRGAELLVEGQMTVTEIAFAIGYSDTTAFGRNFQKHFGQSPKKYAQNKGQST